MRRPTPATNHTDPGPPPWEDLKDWFVRLMFLPEPDWQDTWHLLLTHPWFKSELDHVCSHNLWKGTRAVASVEDLRQEVVGLLGVKLSHNSSLGLKSELADQQFGPWIGAVLQRLCRQARRRLRKQHRTPGWRTLLSQRCTRSLGALDQPAVDPDPELKEAVEKLDFGRRNVIMLRAFGNSYTAIAQLLHCHVSEVKSAERGAHRELRRRLGRDD